jgi:3-methyladenine DNA glycosylase AlkC
LSSVGGFIRMHGWLKLEILTDSNLQGVIPKPGVFSSGARDLHSVYRSDQTEPADRHQYQNAAVANTENDTSKDVQPTIFRPETKAFPASI